MRLRFFVPQSILQCARDKCTFVGIVQAAWVLHKVDALLKRIVLRELCLAPLNLGLFLLLATLKSEKSAAL